MRRRSTVLWLLPLILVAAGLVGPLLLLRQALFWGTPALQFIPWWNYAWETLEQGRMPLWNSLVGMGAPLLANYQSGLLYPPYWFYFLLNAIGDAPLMAWGQALVVGFHLVWAGVGMALLARRLGLGALAQAVSGLAFGFSGYLVGRANFLSINATVAWLPWVLLFLTPRAAENIGRKHFNHALAACLIMLLLAGHAQTAWYTLVLAAIWSAYWGRRSREVLPFEAKHGRFKSLEGVLQTWFWFSLALLAALGIAAVQVLPTAEYLSQSQRSSAVNYELAMSYSFWPWRLLGLAAPGLFGSPVSGDYWGYANFWEDAIYIGLLPFLLALGGVSSALRDHFARPRLSEQNSPGARRQTPGLVFFLLGIFAFSLLLALGQNTPVFPWLYHHVPGFSLFQAPARWMILAVFSLALLAGIGAERWRRPQKRALYWTRLGTMGAFAISLGAGLAWYFMGDVSPSFIRAAALTGALGIFCGVLSLTAPVRREEGLTEPGEVDRREITWQWGVVLFIALDLYIAGLGLLPGVGADFYRERPKYLLETGDARLYLPPEVEETVKFERFLSFETYHPAEPWQNMRLWRLPNLAMLDDQPSANNFDPLVPGRYATWMDHLAQVDEAKQQTLLSLMNVGSVQVLDPSQPLGMRFDSVSGARRFRWIPCASWASNEMQALALVMSEALDVENEIVLEDETGQVKPACLSSGGQPSTAQIQPELISSDLIRLKLTAPDIGWLLLSDTWYPGWRARVNGQPVEILRADYLFRAVAVPAGNSEIEFVYQPLSFWGGLAVSLICLGGWISFIIISRLSHRGKHGS